VSAGLLTHFAEMVDGLRLMRWDLYYFNGELQNIVPGAGAL
jgi:hypothetical protein